MVRRQGFERQAHFQPSLVVEVEILARYRRRGSLKNEVRSAVAGSAIPTHHGGHPLKTGVEVNVIRGWLGPVSLETTNRKAEITVRMKQDALSLCEPAATNAPKRKPVA